MENKDKENIEQKDQKEDKNPMENLEFNGKNSLYIFVVILIMYFLIMGGYGMAEEIVALNKEEKELNLVDGKIETVEDETVLTCYDYTPIFDVDGNKKYEVRFRSNDLKENVVALVDSEEIDEKKNIEKDAKYKCVVEYSYIDKAFEERLKDVEDEDKESVLVSILQSKSELTEYSKITGIEFMYDDNIVSIDKEKNLEILNNYMKEEESEKETTEKNEKPNKTIKNSTEI